jgi:hypothetical protein
MDAETRRQRRRQRDLTAWIGRELYGGAPLIPLFKRGAFWKPPRLPLDDTWLTQFSDRPIGGVAWRAVAQQLEDAAQCHVLDHAWWFGFRDKPHEPWGFVTELYFEEADARVICTAALNEMAGCAAQLRVLPGERSTWNPPATLPIIATFEKDAFPIMLRRALAFALNSELADEFEIELLR